MSSRLFEFVSRHGHDIAQKRAEKAHPDLAEREAARRVKPGIVLGSEGPGGLDGMFADMALSHEYRPWWLRVALHAHWWLEKHGPQRQRRHLRIFWQRGRRGWADEDIWNLDSYLAKVIRDSVKEYDRTKHGWPGEPMTFEEWGEILNEIADGMQAHLDLTDVLKTEPHEWPDLQQRRELAFLNLAKHFSSLWD